MKTCEIFLAMNEHGDWVTEYDESDALTKLQEDQGGYHCRIVKVVVHMTPPVMHTAEVTMADENGVTRAMSAHESKEEPYQPYQNVAGNEPF